MVDRDEQPGRIVGQIDRSPQRRRDWLEGWTVPVLVGFTYSALVYFALAFRFQSNDIAIIWPANGFAIGILLLLKRRFWHATYAAWESRSLLVMSPKWCQLRLPSASSGRISQRFFWPAI